MFPQYFRVSREIHIKKIAGPKPEPTKNPLPFASHRTECKLFQLFTRIFLVVFPRIDKRNSESAGLFKPTIFVPSGERSRNHPSSFGSSGRRTSSERYH